MNDPAPSLSDDERQAERQRDDHLRVWNEINKQAVAYTRSVITVSYAVTIGIWAFVRGLGLMSPRQHAAAGILLILSVTVFSVWEVGMMLLRNKAVLAWATQLQESPEDLAAGHAAYERHIRSSSLSSATGWMWIVRVCVGTGLVAVGVIIWGLVSFLWRSL